MKKITVFKYLLFLFIAEPCLAEDGCTAMVLPPKFAQLELSLGAFATSSVAFGTNGIPSVAILVPLSQNFAIGPEGYDLNDPSAGSTWAFGFRATYYVDHDRFTEGLIFSLLNQEGESQNLTGDVNHFSHTALLAGYEWVSDPFYGNLRFQGSVAAGFGYTHNTNCAADAHCGFGGSPDSYLVWGGEGFFPEASVRIGVNF